MASGDNTVPIEAVADALAPPTPDGVAPVVLYGGKGGVGKTTMAAATGLTAAMADLETLVISTDPAHSLGDSFATPLTSTPSRPYADLPLWAVEIDPSDAVGDIGELDGLGMMPGADEAVAVEQLLRYADDDRYDRIVIDTAPTGHTLRLLELPSTLDRLMDTVSAVRDQLGGLFGGAEGAGGDLGGRVEDLRMLLEDPRRTDFRIVLIPEQMSVQESARLLERLEAYAIPVQTLVVNRLMTPLEDLPPAVADAVAVPDLEGCAFCAARWAVQRDAIGDATELFGDRTVHRVPLLGGPVEGRAALRVIAHCLS
jgi:arsenite efflux ATP-binding protein ArsA (TC 3.A.4.1.1)